MNKLTLAVVLGMGMSLPLGAMASTDDMESFVDYLIGVHDRVGDMDW